MNSSIMVGNTQLLDIKIGDIDITKVYIGDIPVFGKEVAL